MKRRALSLAEVIISVFLLSFAALGVLSMARMAFVAQRRNENQLAATLEAQAIIAEVRVWASNPDNFLGNWSRYSAPFPAPHVPEYRAQVRCLAAGLWLDSPCHSLEAQWDGTPEGVRRMPRAVVPVEVSVAWSERESDRVVLTTYVGEPRRVPARAEVTGPNPDSLTAGAEADYSVRVFDVQNREMQNLLFRWSVDARYLTTESPRSGRTCKVKRESTVPPPIPAAPAVLPVQCFASYAGRPVQIVPAGVKLQ